MGVKHTRLLRLVYAAVCLALALIMPFISGNIPAVGSMLCLMHIPVLLCGFLCGRRWGAVVGFAAPLLRFALVGAPPIFPVGAAMAFELAAYGLISGTLYSLLPKRIPTIFVSLMGAMLGGRLIWGAVRYILAGLSGSKFSFALFIEGAFTQAVPGIIIQIIAIPLLVRAFERAGLIINYNNTDTNNGIS